MNIHHRVPLPNLPTLAAADVAGYEFAGWCGMLTLAGLPGLMAGRMAAALEQAMRESAIREGLPRTGSDFGRMLLMAFTSFVRAHVGGWSSAARDGLMRRAP